MTESAPRIAPAILVIADISGYTKFIRLNRIAVMHAEVIVSELLESVTENADFPLVLNRMEGDAAFFHCEIAPGQERAAVNDVAGQIARLFSAFCEKHQDLLERSVGGCICDACCHIDVLRLKAFAHIGETVLKSVEGRLELGGEPPIVIHRLTKNDVPSSEYVLATEAF